MEDPLKLNFPAAQIEHMDIPVPEYCPATQLKHNVTPAPEKVPAVQGVERPLAQKEPAGHVETDRHAETPAAEYVLAAQVLQTDAPALE